MATATFRLNQKLNGIEVSFDAKPSEEIRNELKNTGFRWSMRLGFWYAKQGNETIALAERICGKTYAVTETKPEKKQETKPEKKQKPEKPEPSNTYGVKVGDLFVKCFGYDATLHTFYQVTSIKGKVMIEVREVGCVSKSTGACSWDSMPKRNDFKSEPMTKKTKIGFDGKTIYAGDLYQGNWDRWYENDNYH
jgi:hypothetical protein